MSKLKIEKLGYYHEKRLPLIQEEITKLLMDAGHSITKALIEDVAVIIFNRENTAFYKEDVGQL